MILVGYGFSFFEKSDLNPGKFTGIRQLSLETAVCIKLTMN
jgi:hypothetical protein